MASDGPFVDNRCGAAFSPGREYRYRLWRTWDASKPTAVFVMLNPSTANEFEDDQTIRRCIDYASQWGYGRLEVVNLFAARATDPADLREHRYPVGPFNHQHIRYAIRDDAFVLAAWGNHGELYGRGREVAAFLDRELTDGPYALGTTKRGHPWHPLRKPADATPEAFSYGEEGENGE